MTARPPRSLSRILAIKLLQALLAAFLLLTGFYFVRYVADVPGLRRYELDADTADIVRVLREGGDPRTLPDFRLHPEAYAFRVLERGTLGPRQLIAESNSGGLLPAVAYVGDKVANEDLENSFDRRPAPDPRGDDIWQLTARSTVGKQHVWIETAMRGDPAHHWTTIMLNEMLDHVIIPYTAIFPLLAVLLFVAMHRALRPLPALAAQAEAVGAKIAAGRSLTPLPEAGLPLELGRLVAALNVTLHKLDESFAQQRHFAADAAHQLRTPLAVLTLEIDRLPPGEAREHLGEEVDRLTRLVNQLLQLARATDGMAREREPLDLAATARKVAEDLAAIALGRAQVIEFDAEAEPIAMLGNPAMVSVAIANIIDNALRYSPPGSTITVGVMRPASVVVSDCGPGVHDAHKRLIFERLFRADPRREDGTGIGLALVQRIAQLHGGHVAVTDRPGGGARFTLSFPPLAGAETAAAAPARSDQPWRASTLSTMAPDNPV